MIACPHCPHLPASIEALDAHVAAVHGKGVFRLVRTEASELMLTLGTEAWLCEAAMEERSAANWDAMLAAHEPLTEAEIDELAFQMFRSDGPGRRRTGSPCRYMTVAAASPVSPPSQGAPRNE